MKQAISLVLLFFACTILTSCNKELTGADAEFVGLWFSDFSEINIKKDGTGSYYDDVKAIEGKVRIKDNQLKVSTLGMKKELTIDIRPTIDNSNSFGRTYMVLDSVYFYKN